MLLGSPHRQGQGSGALSGRVSDIEGARGLNIANSNAADNRRQGFGVSSLGVNGGYALGPHLDDVLVHLQRRPPAWLQGRLHWRRPCQRPSPGAAQSVAAPARAGPKGRQDASDA